MFNHLRLRTKLALLLGLSALAVIASIASGAMTVRDRMVQDRVDKLRAVVQSTVGIARAMEAQVAAKTMTHDQAVQRTREAMYPMRFDNGSGYVTMSSEDGIVMIQPIDPAREGKATTAKAGDGRLLNALYADTLRTSDEGVVSYAFPRPGQTQPLPKIAFVARFAPWHAVVLSGAYTDDLDADFNAAVLRLSLIGGIILLLTIVVAFVINRDISLTLSGLSERNGAPGAGRPDGENSP